MRGRLADGYSFCCLISILRGVYEALVIKGVGWDKISEIAGIMGELVMLKIFAIPWFGLNI